MELSQELLSEINRFLDCEGRLTVFPSKTRNKVIALLYLSTKFHPGMVYTEKEINAIIEQHHTFQDKWLLRRELIDRRFLSRKIDGSQYWVSEEPPKLEELLPSS